MLLTSDKEKIIKEARGEKNVTHKITEQFLLETLQVRRQSSNTSKVLDFYIKKTSFKITNKTKSFSDIRKLKEFITSNLSLQKMLKEALQL